MIFLICVGILTFSWWRARVHARRVISATNDWWLLPERRKLISWLAVMAISGLTGIVSLFF